MRFRNKIAELIILISQNLFFVRGNIRNLIWKLIEKIINYNPKNNPRQSRVKAIVNGIPFYFYFDYMSDVKIAFGNYNKKEIDFLIRNMKTDSTFVDIGSNIGFYSMNIANIFPEINFLQIISIEPNPLMITRQRENIELLDKIKNGIKEKMILENYAVSDDTGNFQLDLAKGYGSAFLTEKASKNSIAIKTTSLNAILSRLQVKSISCLKIDIEGHEDRALIPFFESAPRSLYPLNMVIEFTSMSEWKNSNLLDFLKEVGYELQFKTRSNICLSLRP